jgi:acetolactate synthase-1/2/3 large subunit
MPEMKGGEVIVEHLVQERVPYVFGLCGHGILGLLDALYDRRDRIRTVSVHHESAAALMADAWYRVRQEPVATFSSCGPGSANLPVGVASAFMDSSAFLAITGNVPTQQWNRGPFQETGRHFQGEFVNVLRPYVKRSFQPTRVDMLPLALRQAFGLMRNGRPGPVHLDVPLNVFVEEAEVEPAPSGPPAAPPAGDPEAVRRAAALLAAAKRPVIVAGHGLELSRGEAALVAFAEAGGIPVATTPLGKGAIDGGHPLSLGATGRNGTYMANAALRNADVVLALGTRFDDRATSAWLPGYTYRIPPTHLIHVDIDPAEIGRNFPVELGIIGDARLVLEQLLAATGPIAPDRSRWLTKIDEWRERWETSLATQRTSPARPIRPERLLAELRRALPDDGIVLADVGVHHNWLVCDFTARRPRTLLQSWGFASMGFGVAGALGAKLAAPERPVVAVCGDGGFLMMPSAVATAVEYGIPVVWLVWNNFGFCSIRDQQIGFFGAGRELATSFLRGEELTTCDFGAMARSMGAEGAVVERPEDLGEQLRAALAAERPTVLDVRVDREARPPAAASWDLPPLPAPAPTFGWGEDGVEQ